MSFLVPSDLPQLIRALLFCSALLGASSLFSSPAIGADSGHGGGHGGGHSGGRGKHSGGGHDAGGHDESGDDHGRGGPGRGGHGRDAALPGAEATEVRVLRGRRPVWASPDFPEVELGRLNVSRAPSRVLDHARLLAAEEMPADAASLYGLSAEQAALRFATAFDEIERFHSPLQNLALYRELMTFGRIEFFDFDPSSLLDLAAILLASAGERSKPITADTIRALNMILGLVDLSAEDTLALAAKAELVRAGLETGHGPEGDHTEDESDHGGPGGGRGSGSGGDHGGDDHGDSETHPA